jgi:hypothetical protein
LEQLKTKKLNPAMMDRKLPVILRNEGSAHQSISLQQQELDASFLSMTREQNEL